MLNRIWLGNWYVRKFKKHIGCMIYIDYQIFCTVQQIMLHSFHYMQYISFQATLFKRHSGITKVYYALVNVCLLNFLQGRQQRSTGRPGKNFATVNPACSVFFKRWYNLSKTWILLLLLTWKKSIQKQVIFNLSFI